MLDRGYSVAVQNGAAVSSVRDITVDDPLTIRLRDGSVETAVRKIVADQQNGAKQNGSEKSKDI